MLLYSQITLLFRKKIRKNQNKQIKTNKQHFQELINKLSKAVTFKVTIQKSIISLYSSNELLETKISKFNTFIKVPPKSNTYQINIFKKHIQNLYAEHYKN